MSSLHVILPVQDAQLAMPQKRLMLAVLQTVLHDCEVAMPAGATSDQSSEGLLVKRRAIAYVECRDRSWPFSFDNICDAIGLDAEGIRRKLRHSCDDHLGM
jgi:hypothetical protein